MEDYEYSKVLYFACGIQASKLDIQMAQFVSVVCKYDQNSFVFIYCSWIYTFII